MQPALALASLGHARVIADHAQRLGVTTVTSARRRSYAHAGALLADAALQAGLNYRTVVQPRVERIKSIYREAETFPGLDAVLNRTDAGTFLQWNHVTKIERFLSLNKTLGSEGLYDVADLRDWLAGHGARERLLNVVGVGPKTFDYMCCLAGLDHIPVDRHIKSFAAQAGVDLGDYGELQTAVSFAADLLGLARRDFDAWIWQRLASQTERQPTFAFT